MNISVIIPAFNEEKGIFLALKHLLKSLESFPEEHHYEVVVVDDGSTDRTIEIIQNIESIKVIKRPYNIGYGAAIKMGVRAAKYEWILMLDSDGQHRPEDLQHFFDAQRQGYDLIIGERQKGSHKSWIRQPGKKLMNMVANYLADVEIPDVNSGMRLFKREVFLEYMSLYPNGFSISTTMTLAFLGDGYSVKFVPITTHERVGRGSNVRMIKDGFGAIVMIIRTVSLFNPLRVYLPCAIASGIVGLWLAITDLFRYGSIPKSGILMLLGSLLIFLFGVLSDQVSILRRQHFRKDK